MASVAWAWNDAVGFFGATGNISIPVLETHSVAGNITYADTWELYTVGVFQLEEDIQLQYFTLKEKELISFASELVQRRSRRRRK